MRLDALVTRVLFDALTLTFTLTLTLTLDAPRTLALTLALTLTLDYDRYELTSTSFVQTPAADGNWPLTLTVHNATLFQP